MPPEIFELSLFPLLIIAILEPGPIWVWMGL